CRIHAPPVPSAVGDTASVPCPRAVAGGQRTAGWLARPQGARRTGGTWATENAARRQRDQANARSLWTGTLVSRVRGPLPVAAGPLDGWQGPTEPCVLDVRGRLRTQPGPSGTRAKERDFGQGTL